MLGVREFVFGEFLMEEFSETMQPVPNPRTISGNLSCSSVYEQSVTKPRVKQRNVCLAKV